jgi:MerR family transcriptional regulator/heat shock protein HspR
MTVERSDTSREGAPEACSVETALVITGVSATRLARFERARIVTPVRVGRRRFYRPGDLKRIRKASRLEQDLGINLAGVEVILRLTDQLEDLQRRLADYEAQARTAARRR